MWNYNYRNYTLKSSYYGWRHLVVQSVVILSWLNSKLAKSAKCNRKYFFRSFEPSVSCLASGVFLFPNLHFELGCNGTTSGVARRKRRWKQKGWKFKRDRFQQTAIPSRQIVQQAKSQLMWRTCIQCTMVDKLNTICLISSIPFASSPTQLRRMMMMMLVEDWKWSVGCSFHTDIVVSKISRYMRWIVRKVAQKWSINVFFFFCSHVHQTRMQKRFFFRHISLHDKTARRRIQNP